MTHDILIDWRTAQIGKKLGAMVDFLARLTQTPESITPYHIAVLRTAGVSDRAFVDAVYICMGFNVINRIADAMDFKIPPTGVVVRGAEFMHKFGYKMMSGSWRGNNGLRAFRARDNQSLIDPYERLMRGLKESVLSGPGTLDSRIRNAAGAGAKISGAIGGYVKKVAQRDYVGLDEDISKLLQEGYSDDQIFEATVSAALGAGIHRLELALSALRTISAQEFSAKRSVSEKLTS